MSPEGPVLHGQKASLGIWLVPCGPPWGGHPSSPDRGLAGSGCVRAACNASSHQSSAPAPAPDHHHLHHLRHYCVPVCPALGNSFKCFLKNPDSHSSSWYVPVLISGACKAQVVSCCVQCISVLRRDPLVGFGSPRTPRMGAWAPVRKR